MEDSERPFHSLVAGASVTVPPCDPTSGLRNFNFTSGFHQVTVGEESHNVLAFLAISNGFGNQS